MRLRDLYLLLIRLFLGYVFASAGLCKLTQGQFGQLIGPPTAAMLPGLEGIWEFLATTQVLAGALVLSGRWGLTGLLALLPLNAGILAYTIGNHWTGTPFVNGLLLILNMLALAAEWPALRFLLHPEAPAPLAPPRLVQLWPGWQLPALTLTLLIAAAATALLRLPVWLPTLLGTAGFVAAWTHALRARALSLLERAALALPGAAVVALSLAAVLTTRSVFPLMLAGVAGGALAVGALTVVRLRGKPDAPHRA